MRTKNEKILLGILIAIVVLGGNFYGYQWLSKKQVDLDLTYKELLADQSEALFTLKDDAVTTAAQRLAWIKQNESPMGEEDMMQPQVLDAVVKGATDNKLEIVNRKIDDTQTDTIGKEINVTVTVKGSMQGLVHWLADLQKPQNFYAVTELTLKVDPEDQKSMLCTLNIGRYFKDGT
jgi:hypothetical protein